jgi:tetratricopeptide (TPR) repeat protein
MILFLIVFFAIMGLGIVVVVIAVVLPKLGDAFLYVVFGSQTNAIIRPQYSKAEARYKQGKYEESLYEYRKVLAQYPDDVFAHVRIAEVLIEHFQNPSEAVLQLERALPNTREGESRAFLLNRLADVYLEQFRNYDRARSTLQKIMEEMPETKWSLLAEKRIETLHQMESGQGPKEHIGKDGEKGFSVDVN